MLFSKKRRKRRIKKSANNYTKKYCSPLSSSPKDTKTIFEACRRFNSKRIK